ncbi:hypothetical protein [Anoxynatronum sibiricum]|uniref:Uncharacterized protein n=1 Tax=Anoxynatronum sibiricum TaxID=210623 RepID=A0ABU9VWC2_9CLOT
MNHARLKRLEQTFSGTHKGPVSYTEYSKAHSRQIELYIRLLCHLDGEPMPPVDLEQQAKDRETMLTFRKYNPSKHEGWQPKTDIFDKYLHKDRDTPEERRKDELAEKYLITLV